MAYRTTQVSDVLLICCYGLKGGGVVERRWGGLGVDVVSGGRDGGGGRWEEDGVQG